MFQKRTDLALEAQELWKESAEETTNLSGVRARETRREGCAVTRVDILDGRGAAALGGYVFLCRKKRSCAMNCG